MTDLRRLIEAERERQGRSVYWLAARVAELRGQSGPCRAVYDWMACRFVGSTAMVEDCARALGCEIRLVGGLETSRNQLARKVRTAGKSSAATRISDKRTKS